MGSRRRTTVHSRGVWLGVVYLAATSGAAGESPGDGQLARFQERVRQDMTTIPNYTCLETIERAHRDPHSRAFKPVDTVRLEVSSVAGKELFAWPGSHHFEDRDVTSMVTSGAIGTGMFAMFSHKLFVAGKGTFECLGAEKLAGQASIHCQFHLTSQDSGFEITTGTGSEVVAAKGSFWFDPLSLDLMRLDVYGEAMPYSLRLEEAVFQTNYARTRIGAGAALLPKRTELTMTHFSGEASRDVIEFSDCREYRSESTIRFDTPPASLPESPKATREVDLPAGLLVPVELEAAIVSKTASVGDPLRGRVVEDVRQNGELMLPRGAVITGHIRKLDRNSGAKPFAVGIELSDVEWAGAHATFYGEMVDLDAKSAGTHRPLTYFDNHAQKVAIDALPGAGVFYIDGGKFHIPPGFHMVWRTRVISR